MNGLTSAASASLAQEVPQVSGANAYLAWVMFLVVLAIVVIVIPVFLAKRPVRQKRANRHGTDQPQSAWIASVETIRSDYHAKKITEKQAYSRLSKVARAFASERLGTDLSAKTLLDLNRRHQSGSKAQFDSLRRTIAALYPPEFADAKSNRAANDATVDDAANWVNAMIGRWLA